LHYNPTYGPVSSGNPDDYLNIIDQAHLDNVTNQTVYSWQSQSEGTYGWCPGDLYSGTTLPRFNDEEETGLGLAPSSQTSMAPNDEVNGPRIVDTTNVLNQCGGATFSPFTDIMGINSVAPMVISSWYDMSAGRVLLQSFMKNLDPAATPLTVTLGGGCAAGKCSYAALGSSSHIRIDLNSATGNGGTGVPNAVSGGTITLNVPQPNMTGKWWNPANGSIIGTVTSSSTAGIQTFTVPEFNVDMWFQLD
jgi:hypothetical protein